MDILYILCINEQGEEDDRFIIKELPLSYHKTFEGANKLLHQWATKNNTVKLYSGTKLEEVARYFIQQRELRD